MSEINNPHVSFFLSSDSFDPVEVSEILMVTPTHTHRRGDSRMGRLAGTIFTNSVWLFESDLPSNATLDSHLRYLAEQLLPRANELAELIRAGWRAEFRCGIFLQGDNAGATIQADTVRAIAQLGSAVGLDVYPGGDEEIG